ncbi:basic salivary proline-rich protein 4-like [Equus quagga]|uniref:basic salivary proline-rich protein 4-like n=1 Tax=Equus quagga TaxID=89248 RepID=UPI001EE1F1C4|nr:basic salivary proline-rich protein 4-like [Equus quagga]
MRTTPGNAHTYLVSASPTLAPGPADLGEASRLESLQGGPTSAPPPGGRQVHRPGPRLAGREGTPGSGEDPASGGPGPAGRAEGAVRERGGPAPVSMATPARGGGAPGSEHRVPSANSSLAPARSYFEPPPPPPPPRRCSRGAGAGQGPLRTLGPAAGCCTAGRDLEPPATLTARSQRPLVSAGRARRSGRGRDEGQGAGKRKWVSPAAPRPRPPRTGRGLRTMRVPANPRARRPSAREGA